ncbi:Uma2 family endonuclease [Nocardioides soli]|uniref:Uma2 family endonuclease n=1 Tax=Nocardioides soli TaxID=1036020 RepID=A0A7W4Z080_9ACTN|nr:Uma2 family endonuclease [Nocardioides soli]MBB3041583.1 Uma2 family endonuclease [Nocardioides soli]
MTTLLRHDVIVREGPYTRAERDAVPPNGRHHELLDGVLVMTPAQGVRHQSIVGSLAILLADHAPRDCKVLLGPFDVALGPASILQPDVLVGRRTDFTEIDLPTAPLLAVEVLSPSTRLFDLGRKKELLAEAGCPSYWTIDPTRPELTVWQLDNDRYVAAELVGPDDTWTATAPYPVTITPRDLIDD